MPSALRTKKLQRLFGAYDTDQDGVMNELDVTSLAQMWCDTYDLTPRSEDWNNIHRTAHRMFREMPGTVDTAGEKRVAMDEWVAWGDHPDFPRFVETAAIPFSMAVFAAADKDGDGRISAPEMMAAQIKGGMSEEETNKAFALLDTNGDGYVTSDEYIDALREFYSSDDPAARGNHIAGEL
ncbi:EF hand domain-containing protein [Nocardia tenerifensis]|uniref:EF hand domain-containing protein n=1 Tax=Nocardia tenerifensis TaxID=228006 RepID=A0A318KE92_9NOCA|nr:EF-hand domain-containing protein [Nocardia tenerifensis]PXX70592.1 EF hand domain-containing protein [Nocardia tenerifensis]